MPRSSAHAELASVEQRLADARSAQRDAEVKLIAAETAIEQARDAVREAHDLGADATKPTKALEQAKRDAEQAALAQEGIAQRVQRATATRDTFIADNGERLLDELRPECEQVAADMRDHADALLADDARWAALQRTVASYLMAMHLSPADNAPGSHELAPVLRDLRRVLSHEITSPAPHLTERAASREEQQRKAALRHRRDRDLQAQGA